MTSPPTSAAVEVIAHTDVGLHYGPAVIDDPVYSGFLTQLLDMGLADEKPDGGVLLPWPSLHDVLDDEELGASPSLVPVPPVDDSIVPVLTSRGGTIPDPGFAIQIKGWRRRGGAAIAGELQFHGPVGSGSTGAPFTLGRHAYRTREAVLALRRRPESERTPRDNRLRFVDIRDAAEAAGADMDRMLTSTIILRPRTVGLDLRSQHVGDNVSVTVAPTFEGAPSGWLRAFDRSSRHVRDVYSIPGEGGEDVQIVVDDAVREVLQEVRNLPSRRVAGPRARQLLENPFAFFGDTARSVLDVEAVEASLAALREDLWGMRAHVEVDDDRQVAYVDVFLEPLGETSSEGTEARRITTADGLRTFAQHVAAAAEAGHSAFTWRGRDVSLTHRSGQQAAELLHVADAWEQRRAIDTQPAGDAAAGHETAPDPPREALLISADLVLDVARYYERVESIGVETPYSIITVQLTQKDAWAPDAAEITQLFRLSLKEEPGHDDVAFTADELRAFVEAAEEAERTGAPTIGLPGGGAVATSVARAIIDSLPRNLRSAAHPETSSTGAPAATEPAARQPRIGLQLKSNIDKADYVTSREDRLRPEADDVAVPPTNLVAGVALKKHQEEGLKVLQHLFRESPDGCRGVLLADDMGLGKTLQILALIAWARERDPDLAPALVVAPVTLLENWAQEIRRFFGQAALPFATLYGPGLRAHRAAKGEIDPRLRDGGLTRFLRPGWTGDSAIVLTTYETLRDYEFSFADVEWSIVACDEAQKIKNPNALMSRAAKKLDARFYIAATGTPVENSLADLWSLFDFIQPGLMEPLNTFNRLYRRPIEARTGDEKERLEALRRLIEPQIIRRTKADVLRDLPPKLLDEASRELTMSSTQRDLYAAALKSKELAEAVGSNNGTVILSMLAVLRRICTDPRSAAQLQDEYPPLSEYRAASPKLDWLIAALEEIRAREEKALIFLDRKDIQRVVQHYVREAFGRAPEIVNGETPTAGGTDSRQRRVDRFQEAEGFNVLILSPVAAGVGLNIQGANHVIHYMRHWNPAKEDQATDRAHRIGQTREVHVYTPIVRGDGWTSFDERLDDLLAAKRSLAGDILNGAGDIATDELKQLLEVGTPA